jgi:hypothetical protein
MFKEEYIIDLIYGKLTQKGYASIVSSIASMIRQYHWQKNIVVTDSSGPDWTNDDIKELAQQFFEWIIANDKLKYVEKIPREYLAYYFTQMLVSFVANRIKEEQQKVGISFQKCQELVKEVCDESFIEVSHKNRYYIKSPMASEEIWIDDLEDSIKYLAHYPITEKTKQFKSIVKLAIDDILMSANGYVLTTILPNAVFQLLDQSTFAIHVEESVKFEELIGSKYGDEINSLMNGVSKVDAQLILEYLFQDDEKVSLSELAVKYEMPKSTIHKLVSDFKHNIFRCYIPENEEDGISFLKKLANALDERAK